MMLSVGGAVLVLATWLTGNPNAHQTVTVEVRSMAVCEAMAEEARAKMDVRGYNVKAFCLEVRE